MATVTAPWWLWWVLGGLDAAGFLAVCWVISDWAEQARDWLRDRREDFTEAEEETAASLREQLGLPPERTWEQMTSHQLPVTGSDRNADDLMDGGGLWHGPYAPMLERRAPWWETEQRQAYAALDLEYPSGLLARVRESVQ